MLTRRVFVAGCATVAFAPIADVAKAFATPSSEQELAIKLIAEKIRLTFSRWPKDELPCLFRAGYKAEEWFKSRDLTATVKIALEHAFKDPRIEEYKECGIPIMLNGRLSLSTQVIVLDHLPIEPMLYDKEFIEALYLFTPRYFLSKK